MGTRAVERGQVAEAVATNVKAIRERRGLTQQELSAATADLGRPMLASAIAKVEAGDRRVDVDDLVALAAALNVSPARLLLPDVGETEPVALTSGRKVPAWSAWQWMEGIYALPADMAAEGDDDADLAYHDARPNWLRAREQHPLYRATRHLTWRAVRVLHHAGKAKQDKGLATTLKAAREAVRGVTDELDRIEAEAGRG